MPAKHYENFPVASVLLPPHLRDPVAKIYRFARKADDFADEGNIPSQERLIRLADYTQQLKLIEGRSIPDQNDFAELQKVIEQWQLPISAFHALLSAFSQDVVTTRYETYDELLDYCSRSANPVGLLMLHLFGCVSDENIAQSNAICSALQLINFWQDVAIDWQKGRVYLPLADLRNFNVSEADIANGQCSSRWQKLIEFEVERTRELMLSGAPLIHKLPGRFGWEIRLTIQGGLRILEKIKKVNGDIFCKRPMLTPLDWVSMSIKACLM